MATLSKRASPLQEKLLRMIEGAVRNTMHAHPGLPLDDRMARSISKRAAGAISAQWGSLAACKRSDREISQ